MSTPQIIHFDYLFSPYGQKTKLLLALADIPFQRINQPPLLPRPDLEELGITYRRIPLLAVGRDVYADSSLVIDVILDKLGGSGKVKTDRADKAYEAWGNATFAAILPLLPKQALTPSFVQDRKTIFPTLEREDLDTLNASAEAELRSRLAYLEDVLLADSPFVGGEKPSVADVHIIWPLRWVLRDLGAGNRPGLGKENFPKVWALIEKLPAAEGETVESEVGLKRVLDAELSAGGVEVQNGDALGIAKGTEVTVESMDATPGSHPQVGKLIGASKHEFLLELHTGVRLHFPRQGYVVRQGGSGRGKL